MEKPKFIIFDKLTEATSALKKSFRLLALPALFAESFFLNERLWTGEAVPLSRPLPSFTSRTCHGGGEGGTGCAR